MLVFYCIFLNFKISCYKLGKAIRGKRRLSVIQFRMQNYIYEDLFIKENISIQSNKQSQQRLVWENQIAFLPDWTQAESVNINFISSLSIPGILCAPVITLLLRQMEERWRHTNSKVTCHIMQLPICQHYLIGQLKKIM